MTGNRPFDAVVWDMNGVLLDDESHQWEAFKRVLAGREILMPDTEFERYCGVTEAECFAHALSLKSDHPSIRECMTERRNCYREILGGSLPFYPGAVVAVQRIERASLKQAIASGACRDEVMAVVEALGPHRFGAVVAAEDVRRGKPDPEGYLKAATALNVSPERCLVIEDSIHGVEAALAAGMQCFAVAHTLPPERLSHAHQVFPTLEAVFASDELGF